MKIKKLKWHYCYLITMLTKKCFFICQEIKVVRWIISNGLPTITLRFV